MTIVITGCSSGIGRAAAIELASHGASIAVVGRNFERTEAVATLVGGRAFVADFDRLDEVRSLADALLTSYAHINVLANNAGGLVSRRGLSVDGHELTFQRNHLAPFLLTSLLLPRLAESHGRVISTASAANLAGRVDLLDLNSTKRPYAGGWRAYGTSKLETIMFIHELARRTAALNVDSYAFHPGLVATGFGADSAVMRAVNLVGRGILSPEVGAAGLVFLASTKDVGAPSGTYFDGLKPFGRTRARAGRSQVAEQLWRISEALVAQKS